MTDDQAFLAATGSDFAAFDDAWVAAQGAAEPKPFGPLPAPLGPLPRGLDGHPRRRRRRRPAPGRHPEVSSTGSAPGIRRARRTIRAQTPITPAGVLSNPRFLALFLSQILTQVGGNMVLYGLTIQVYNLTQSATSTAILLLTFLVPAVVFGAIAGVFVDRYDRRKILIWTNIARGVLFLTLILFDQQLLALYLITMVVATLTTFFAPAETAMIPLVVKRDDLMTANGLFVLGLQASFALGFAVLGPLLVAVTGVNALIGFVAGLYLVAGVLCWTLPAAPSVLRDIATDAVRQAGIAIRATMSAAQGRPGLHPGPQEHLLGAHVPHGHVLAHRRPGRARAGVRGQGPGSPADGLLGARAAARHRPRGRHRGAAQVRSVRRPQATHRDRARRAGHLAAHPGRRAGPQPAQRWRVLGCST